MNLTPAQARTIHSNLRALRDLERKRRVTAMQVFCHPDASANMVMQIQGDLVRAAAAYNALRKQVYEDICRVLSRWGVPDDLRL